MLDSHSPASIVWRRTQQSLLYSESEALYWSMHKSPGEEMRGWSGKITPRQDYDDGRFLPQETAVSSGGGVSCFDSAFVDQPIGVTLT
jgi:hypothetical protein